MKSLYIHIPFCARKCLFCSFAISVGAGHRSDEYIDALEKELQQHQHQKISTIYFGGGTPTFLNDGQISRIVLMIKNNFCIDANASWSIEANPESIDENKARQLRKIGFNRVSLGVQTFNDTYLKFLGRAHDKATALNAFFILRDAGFDNINVDLMYGFPKQLRDELDNDLQSVVSLSPEHVSIYTLTIEPNSRFHAAAIKLDDDEKLGDDYVFVAQFLESKGIMQYEVSNFARPGFQSKHNLAYWQGGDYIGVGMGAHGLLDGRRYWNEATLSKYIDAINSKGLAVAGEEHLDRQTRFTEDLIFGLRMNEGICVQDLEKRCGVEIKPEQRKMLEDLIEDGFLEKVNDAIRTTLNGRLVLDELAVRLI